MKIIILRATILVFIMTLMNCNGANNILIENTNDDGRFIFTINNDDDLSDISKIEVAIYGTKNNNNNIHSFETEYCFSVYTDKKGCFSFIPPSKRFSITVNLETLPTNTGINFQSCFFEETFDSLTGETVFDINNKNYINLSVIEKVEIVSNYGEYYPVIYNKKGEIIVADYNMTNEIIRDKDFSRMDIFEINEIDIFIRKIEVTVYSLKYEYTDVIDMSKNNLINKIDWLHWNVFIDAYKTAALYSEYKANPELYVSYTGDIASWVDGTAIESFIQNVESFQADYEKRKSELFPNL